MQMLGIPRNLYLIIVSGKPATSNLDNFLDCWLLVLILLDLFTPEEQKSLTAVSLGHLYCNLCCVLNVPLHYFLPQLSGVFAAD